jgi:hypothetical protein
MVEDYRGHLIRIVRSGGWSAVITELSTGAELPTKATALTREGRHVALARARELIDVYAAVEPAPRDCAA